MACIAGWLAKETCGRGKHPTHTVHNHDDVFADDFDGNNNLDIVLGYFEGDKQYPVRGKQCSSEQVPGIKRKFNSYDAFASSLLLRDLFTPFIVERTSRQGDTTFLSTSSRVFAKTCPSIASLLSEGLTLKT